MNKSTTITIAIIAGTIREGRESIKAAHYVAELGRRLDGVEVLFADPKEFYFAGDGNKEGTHDSRYTEIVERADAFFIVTPEYNHSFPGSLKRMLDSEYSAYFHKPVALAGVSNGPWGGVRVCEALLPVCHRLGLVNILPEVYFPKVQDIFDENGAIHEEFKAMYEQNIAKSYDELLWFARAIKAATDENA
jgi:NAD(P)H-dependent FMN reductase